MRMIDRSLSLTFFFLGFFFFFLYTSSSSVVHFQDAAIPRDNVDGAKNPISAIGWLGNRGGGGGEGKAGDIRNATLRRTNDRPRTNADAGTQLQTYARTARAVEEVYFYRCAIYKKYFPSPTVLFLSNAERKQRFFF